MRTLILGGTRFVGRHITQAAIAAGHEVTLLNRGKSGADLFGGAAGSLIADRDGDLEVLRGSGPWDLVIDVSAYFPRQVTSVAQALEGSAGRYVFISSVSVYDVPAAPGYDESQPVRTLPPGPVPQTVNEQNYGALKALCEQEATLHFGTSTLIVRPTYVIGPHDHLARFTWWTQRLSRGGEVLAPGYPDRAIQTIDARDLADFALLPNSGVFHVASPHKTFGEFLEEIAAHVAPPGTKLTWIDPQPLLDEGHDAESFPLWYAGDDDDAIVNTADPAAAIAAGLNLRPLKATIDDLADEPEAEFLEADDEADLLRRLA